MAPNPASSVVSTLESQVAPTLAADQAGIAQAQTQAQLDPQLYALQSGYNTQQYGNTLQQQALSQQGLNLQEGYTGQQYQDTLAGLGLQQGYLGQQEGFAGQQLGLTLGSGGIGGGGLAAQQANLNYQLPLQLQSQQGAAAASGAGNTVGNQNALGGIHEQYQYNTGNLANQTAQANLGYQQQLAGFGYQQGQLGLQGREAQQQNAYQQGQYGLQQRGLNLSNLEAGQQYQYGQQTAGIQGALQYGQDYSNLQNQIGNAAQTAIDAGSPASVLQGGIYQEPTGGTGQAGN
jgi:hypothetical protein